MKTSNVNYSNYAAYMHQFLGREPSHSELDVFKQNQELMQITRRSSRNDVFQITFVNGTVIQLLTGGILLGGAIQLHSQEGGHRFYSVMFSGQDTLEDAYLMLDVSMDSVLVNGLRTDLVQGVRLITIEDLVTLYSPVMFNLS
ncbi:hypothetical protein ABID22_002824 [Pontibacter aydingkolensis]|uniref:SCP-2 sterol transfer family protein n=1 Tax=Pontibacter aydingkolensis TaxID=1911536 RepID=A0ABS7CX67_9BACT|nr:hypothetical protein [Pontibacter aydingkolensis]MBW7468413.1 hypothetical protein [Pontibacter aydingkolensis]